MLNQGMDLLKEKRYEEFTNNGYFVTSIEAIFLFDRVWNKLSRDDYGNVREITVPAHIVWVNGAPGAGKGTNTRNIMRTMGIFTRPIVVSDLLDDAGFRKKIDQGMLVDDEAVTLLVFEQIFNVNSDRKSNRKSIIIDGYPRTKLQVDCIQLLQMKWRKTLPIKMTSVVLLIDERTSIQRQLARGQNALEHNKKVSQEGVGDLIEVRSTDRDPTIARNRYKIFCDETYNALKLLKRFMDYYSIDAKGSFDEIKLRISEALKRR
jgi:adenylate kinase